MSLFEEALPKCMWQVQYDAILCAPEKLPTHLWCGCVCYQQRFVVMVQRFVLSQSNLSYSIKATSTKFLCLDPTYPSAPNPSPSNPSVSETGTCIHSIRQFSIKLLRFFDLLCAKLCLLSGKCNSSQACEFTCENAFGRETLYFFWVMWLLGSPK